MKKKHSFINIGFSSILMVFIMICIATFASLSVATANSDYNLSKKVATKTTAYYEADTLAKEVLSEIDGQLSNYYYNDSSDYFLSVKNSLKDNLGNSIDDTTNFTVSEEGKRVSYDITISDTQILQIKLEVTYPTSKDDTFIKILNWNTITNNEPSEEDGKLKVYN